MATDRAFVEFVQSQSGLGGELSFKKMFGEYALYLHGRVVAFACDNQLFLKPTDEGRAVLGEVTQAPAYPGSKLYFRLDEQIDDRALLQQALVVTADALPLPKPKSPTRKAAATARKMVSRKAVGSRGA
ncbi:TfoX/Sxy family protein [Piscinibacter koreensis]|uniref:TfoX/Sxy family protein n=1 Tax=Piscinibacter koreensis TaxID=2742824 RepID=A0A7Y6NLE6_9BURK|nr:TfoX/Sxy family protein [Schlegelella koreensis]NUZ05365.1 TfoX/Sxy family protein [Schlegelella koreensis]